MSEKSVFSVHHNDGSYVLVGEGTDGDLIISVNGSRVSITKGEIEELLDVITEIVRR